MAPTPSTVIQRGFFGLIRRRLFHCDDLELRGLADQLLHVGRIVDSRQFHQNFGLYRGIAMFLDVRFLQSQFVHAAINRRERRCLQRLLGPAGG